MRIYLAFQRFLPPIFHLRLINPKPISSQSQFLNPPNNQIRNTESTTETISEPKFHEEASTPNHVPVEDVGDARVVEELLSRKHDPVSALEYCNCVRPWNRICKGGDVFWVLIHILVTSSQTYDRARNILAIFVSSNPTISPNVMLQNLVDSAERFGFGTDPRVFNCLLNSYVRNRRIDYAVECFDLMLERNVIPFVFYVKSLLSSLIRSGLVSEADEIYDKMVEIGVGGDNVTTQLLMRSSLRERKPEEALRIFKRVRSSSGVELDGLLYSLGVEAACKMKDLVLGLDLLREMREKLGVVSGSQEMYTSVIVGFVKRGDMEEAVKVKDEMVGFGIPGSVIAAKSLLMGYCKRNQFGKALDLFNTLEEDKVLFSVMIEWLCRNEKMETAVEVYKRMKSVEITPSSALVHTLIKGCLKAESPEVALEIFNDCFEAGLVRGFMCKKILSLLCKQGKIDAATRLLRMMEKKGIEPDVVSYNNMMLAHCKMKDMDAARLVFSVMLEKGIEPNNFTYSILIDGFFKNHHEQNAFDVVNRMVSSSFEASEVVYNTIINGLCKVGQTSKAKEMLRDLIKEKRCFMSCISYNTIIDGFCREGKIDSAVETYREMSENGISPSVVTFTSLINGYCKIGRMDLALEMRQEMKSKDLKLDVTAYGALIDGFCKKHDMKTAYSLFSELLHHGLIPNVAVYNSLIAGFCSLRNMDAAIDLYKKMVKDGINCDLLTYTTLIDGMLKDGNLIVASDLYSEVLALGIVPDRILCGVLVNGLSKKGQFVRASKLLEEMKNMKDVTPKELIYSAVIAGHYREGNLIEAFRLRDEMLEKGLVHDDRIFDILVSGQFEKAHATAKFC